jgi:hypothetical protein
LVDDNIARDNGKPLVRTERVIDEAVFPGDDGHIARRDAWLVDADEGQRR